MKKRILSLILAGILSVSAAAVVTAEDELVPAAGVVFKADTGFYASTYTGTIDGAESGVTTAGDIIAALENSVGIEVRRADAALAADEVLKKDDKVVLLNSEDSSVKSEFAVAFMGDSNGDSKVNIGDVSAMLKKIAGWEITLDNMMSDVDGDGDVKLSDVSLILKSLAQWDVDFVKNPVIPGKYRMQTKGDVNCYGNPGSMGWSPLCLSDGIHYDLGVKFVVKANEYATQLAFLCPSWADNKGKLTISVYKWDGDYVSSISAMPIISETFIDYEDNSTLFMDIKDSSGKGLVEGEYVWRIHDGVDQGDGTGVGIWYFPELAPAESTGMETFLNCKPFNIGPVAVISYSKAD